jgi:hypothetical protein
VILTLVGRSRSDSDHGSRCQSRICFCGSSWRSTKAPPPVDAPLGAAPSLVPPGTLYGDRLNQLDFRLLRNIKSNGVQRKLQVMLDLYNLRGAPLSVNRAATVGGVYFGLIFVLCVDTHCHRPSRSTNTSV